MAMLTDDQVQEVIGEFKPYFLRKKLLALAQNEDVPKVSFDEFLNSNLDRYESFSSDLEDTADELCRTRAKVVLDLMSEDQRNTLGALFQNMDANFVPYSRVQQSLMDKVVLDDQD